MAGNSVGEQLVKSQMVSLYGKTVQKDFNTKAKLWNENTLQKNFTEDLKFEKIRDDQYYVEVKNELKEMHITQEDKDTEIDDENKHKKTNTTSLMPSHLGVFILAHSKRIMNNFI